MVDLVKSRDSALGGGKGWEGGETGFRKSVRRGFEFHPAIVIHISWNKVLPGSKEHSLCRQRHELLRKLENQPSLSSCFSDLGMTRKRDSGQSHFSTVLLNLPTMFILLPQLIGTGRTKTLGKFGRVLHRRAAFLRVWSPAPSAPSVPGLEGAQQPRAWEKQSHWPLWYRTRRGHVCSDSLFGF